MQLMDGLSTNGQVQLIAVSVVVSFLMAYTSLTVRADGGALRVHQKAGSYDITVFTSPTPIRAGAVDVSVLVQEAATGELVPKADVTVCLKALGTERTLRYPATNDTATNRLFKAAVFELPEAGSWDVNVVVSGPLGPTQVAFAVDANERSPRWREYWPWFTWPAAVVALFGVHRALIQGVSRRAAIRTGLSGNV